ncbi:hypothetical protein LSH36_352g01020 [Paralvinella palmiformis]|uniref:Repulsive guidance molecule C-terminal domain-containing protein n=1 Tax=Paralvinella palmiformis TaxID=53620 RepID=A0AAD9N022_9ANNE|nr:hypothetical protein LSH36_352g01020 [Paralvinella palmiformis]
MGREFSRSQSAGPLLSLLPSVKSNTVGAAPLSTIVILITGLVIMVLTASPGTEALRPGSLTDGQRQTCNTRQCRELFVMSQDYYQVQMEFEYAAHPQLEPEKWRGQCISQRTFYQCLKAMYRNKSLDCHSNIGFRSAHNGIKHQMQEMNCSLDGVVFDPSKVPKDHRQVCTYNGPPALRYCALFGDPHLRTFADQFETCQIQGAWPLLDNRYLTVQVTSKAVNNLAGPATAITQLTVMIKRHDDCAVERFVTYQAQAGFLPPMFDDGSVNFGPENSVQLIELVPNRQVEIYLRYIDTRIMIRHYPNVDMSFLTVGLLMPEMILNQSATNAEPGSVRMLELCSQGCPANQRIDYATYLARGGATKGRVGGGGGANSQRLFTEQKNSVDGMVVTMSRQEALRRCRQVRLVDFYLDSCVFDLMNTGGEQFLRAAADALADAIRYHPDHGAALRNRTTLTLGRRPSDGSGDGYVASSAISDYYSNNNNNSDNSGHLQRTTFICAIISCALTTRHWLLPWLTFFVALMALR